MQHITLGQAAKVHNLINWMVQDGRIDPSVINSTQIALDVAIFAGGIEVNQVITFAGKLRDNAVKKLREAGI